MSRTIVALLCFATLGILGETAHAQRCWFRARCVPRYSAGYYCAPVTGVYPHACCGCSAGYYYAYPHCGYVYYGSHCCLPTQPWPATVQKTITSQKPTVPAPLEGDIEARPVEAEKEPPKKEDTSVLEKPPAEKERMDDNAAPGGLPIPPAREPTRDILSTMKEDGRFTTLMQVTTDAGLIEELNTPGPFTIFAPTDEAFAKLDPEFLDKLLAAPESLRKVLQHHALTEGLLIADAITQGKVPTATGLDIQIQKDGDQVLVDKAKVIENNVQCTNGVVHVIDAVLIPPGFEIPPAVPEEKPAGTPPAPAASEKKPVPPSPE